MKVKLTCHGCGREFERELSNNWRAMPMKAFCRNKCSVEWHRKERRKKPMTPSIY